MDAITNLDQAKAIISHLQSSLSKERKELDKARAIIFDLLYKETPEGNQEILKARIIQLEQDLKESIDKRQKLKELLSNKL